LFSDPEILLFTGSNCTWDFTDVKFEFDTEILSAYDSWVVEFWPVGDSCVFQNLTMEDIGMSTPTDGAEAIHLDGADNRIEGFHITARGSYPYGYGDIFGKGGGSVISHQKHPGVLVRGERNHLLNDTVIMRSYGHGIFMQGSEDALIENCYVEGELRTISEVLEEDGTNSAADNVDFLTVWGYYLTELEYDYRFSLQEDGIRCYTTGTNYGDTTSRSTTGTQIKNCTVVKMRSGVTIGWDYTDKVVENCKVLGCETGFWFGSDAEATGCSGDASVGPLISEDVARSNSNIELTLLDNYVEKIGNTPYFFFAGDGHSLTLNDGTTSFNSDIELQVGGTRYGHRWLEGSDEEPITRSATNLTFINNTKYPVVLEDNASDNEISSCGTVTDNGSDNSVTLMTDCSYTRTCSNTADNLQAECYDNMSGVETDTINDYNELAISDIQSGDWISFSNIDLTDYVTVKAVVATTVEGASIEVREGSESGTLLGTIPISTTTSFSSYEEFYADLDQTVSSSVDVYFVFTGSGDELFNVDQLNFVEDACAEAYFEAYLPISAEDFCASSEEVVIEDLSSSLYQVVSNISDGAYLQYSNVVFGDDDVYNAVEIKVSSGSDGGSVEVRSGSVDGDILATVAVSNTGSWDDYETFIGYTDTDVTGTHDIYLAFSGTSDSLMNVDNFSFIEDNCGGASYDAYSQIEAEEYCEMYGVATYEDSYLGDIQSGDWIRFANVDFTSTSPLSVVLSLSGYTSDIYVDVMLDDPNDGTLIAEVPVTSTGGWTTWEEYLVALNQEVTGEHDVYIVFVDGGVNINYFQFSDEFVKGQTDPYERFEAEINDDEDGVSSITTTDVDGDEEVSDIEDGDYVMFSTLDLEAADSVYARVASAVDGGVIEVRLGSTTGDIISFIDVPNTGSASTWETVSAAVDDVDDEYDIYFVFRGDDSDLFRLNWLQFTTYENSFAKLESEDYDSISDSFDTDDSTDDEDEDGQILEYITSGNWIKFVDVDLTGAKSVDARYATGFSDSYIEVRIGGSDGELIGTIELESTGGLTKWGTASAGISEQSDTCDVYFVYQAESSSSVFCSNWFQFSELDIDETIDPSSRIEAEDYNRASGTVTSTTTDVDGEEELDSIEYGDWILFKNVDLTDLKSIDVRVASLNDNSRIELRTGSYGGSLLTNMSISNTGSTSTWETASADLYSELEGEYNVYLIFKGSTSSDDLLNINWLQFNSTSTGIAETTFSSEEIQLFPNPVADDITITGALGAKVELYNILGNLISITSIESDEQTITMNDLSSGYYLLKVIKSDGTTESFKVIKDAN
jgi:hypothetical protein